MPIEKRINEIMLRKQEIETELRTSVLTESKIEELSKEVDALIAEEKALTSKRNIADRIKSYVPEEKDDLNNRELRGRALKEKRAVTVGGGTLVKPADTQSYVNDMMGKGCSVVDLVKVTNCYGMSEYQVPYISAESTASKNAENTAAADGSPTFAYASIKPVTVTTYSEISRESMKLNDADYFSAVQASAQKALRKKVAEFIMKSDATSNAVFTGIKDSATISADTDISILSIDEKTLRTIALSYGGDEDISGEGILFLTKKDLIAFGDVRGTNEKQSVYTITPDTENTNTGTITDGGLTVRYLLTKSLTDTATATEGDYMMFYGSPQCYELGLFSDYTVRVSEDAEFKKRMLAVLGEVMVGGNVVVKNGFIRVKKSKAETAKG